MTTIAFRDGVLAADTRVTSEQGGRVWSNKHPKLFKRWIGTGDEAREVIFAMAGDIFGAAVFIDWYETGQSIPEQILHSDTDFTVLILEPDGTLWEADRMCKPIQIIDPVYAIGSGGDFALGAMAMGASAERAVEVAAGFDPYSGAPVITMSHSEKAPSA